MEIQKSFFYLDQNISGTWQQVKHHEIFHSVLLSWSNLPWNNCFFYVNPVWPDERQIESIPAGYDTYILIWLTEHIDIFWVKKLAEEKLAGARIICVVDSKYYPSTWYPCNVQFFTWLAWPEIISRMISVFGQGRPNTSPRYHLTSLCNRISEAKFLISAKLARHRNRHRVLMSYHAHLDDSNDLPQEMGIKEIDELLDFKDHAPIVIDDSSRSSRDSINNYDWRIPPFTDSLFCLTNEGFSYSARSNFIQPGPYLTEKTFKPLISGQAILPVGQFETIAHLSDLGFSFDYGMDLSYDSIPGDIDRMLKFFDLIDHILDQDLHSLINDCQRSVSHNLHWMTSPSFHRQVLERNEQTLVEINQSVM